ncbi:MAG: hypothetical protein AAB553_03675 [Patescibacteria group bacterium]
MVAVLESIRRPAEWAKNVRIPEKEKSQGISPETARFLMSSRDPRLSNPKQTITPAERNGFISEIPEMKTSQLPSRFVAQVAWEDRQAYDATKEGTDEEKYTNWRRGFKTWFDGADEKTQQAVKATLTASGVPVENTLELNQINQFYDQYLEKEALYEDFAQNFLAEFDQNGVVNRDQALSRLKRLTPFFQRTFGHLDIVRVIQADIDARSILSQSPDQRRRLAPEIVTEVENPITDQASISGFDKLAKKLQEPSLRQREHEQVDQPEPTPPETRQTSTPELTSPESDPLGSDESSHQRMMEASAVLNRRLQPHEATAIRAGEDILSSDVIAREIAERMVDYQTGEIKKDQVDMLPLYKQLTAQTESMAREPDFPQNQPVFVISNVARAMIQRYAEASNDRNRELAFSLQGIRVRRDNNNDIFIAGFAAPASDFKEPRIGDVMIRAEIREEKARELARKLNLAGFLQSYWPGDEGGAPTALIHTHHLSLGEIYQGEPSAGDLRLSEQQFIKRERDPRIFAPPIGIATATENDLIINILHTTRGDDATIHHGGHSKVIIQTPEGLQTHSSPADVTEETQPSPAQNRGEPLLERVNRDAADETSSEREARRPQEHTIEVAIRPDMVSSLAKKFVRLPYGYSLKELTENIRDGQSGKPELVVEGALGAPFGETSFALAVVERDQAEQQPIIQATLPPDVLCNLVKQYPLPIGAIQELTGEITDTPEGSKQFLLKGRVATSFGGAFFDLTFENEGKGLKVVDRIIDYTGIGKVKRVQKIAESKIEKYVENFDKIVTATINRQLPVGELDSLQIRDGVLELKARRTGQPELPTADPNEDSPERSGSDIQATIAQDILFESITQKARHKIETMPYWQKTRFPIRTLADVSGGIQETPDGKKQFIVETAMDTTFGKIPLNLAFKNETDEENTPDLQVGITPDTIIELAKPEVQKKLPMGKLRELTGEIVDTPTGQKQFVVQGVVNSSFGQATFTITLANEGNSLRVEDHTINFRGLAKFAGLFRGKIEEGLVGFSPKMTATINRLLPPTNELESLQIGDGALELKAKKREPLPSAT